MGTPLHRYNVYFENSFLLLINQRVRLPEYESTLVAKGNTTKIIPVYAGD